MSVASLASDSIEITVRLGGLTVTVVGPAQQASELVGHLTLHYSESARPRSPGLDSQYSVVDPPIASSPALDLRPAHPPSTLASSSPVSQPARARETRDQIERSFSDCPSHLVSLGSRLSGSAISGGDRIRRAYKAGQWAGAVLAGRAGSPNRSSQLDLRPRIYVVLRNSRGPAPICYSSSFSYHRAVGDLSSSNSISHSFPSEAEAKAYCLGADVEYPEVLP